MHGLIDVDVYVDNNYGIITKTGKVYVKPVLTKVYLESENGKDNYYMIYNDKKVNVLEYYQKNNSKAQVTEEVKETETTEKTSSEERAVVTVVN